MAVMGRLSPSLRPQPPPAIPELVIKPALVLCVDQVVTALTIQGHCGEMGSLTGHTAWRCLMSIRSQRYETSWKPGSHRTQLEATGSGASLLPYLHHLLWATFMEEHCSEKLLLI